jgi:hypothetical protein
MKRKGQKLVIDMPLGCYGCVFLREGARHRLYINLADVKKTATIPRQTELIFW